MSPSTVLPPQESAPLFTEFSARRLGPVRRYFVRHPVAMDLLLVAIFFLQGVGGALALHDEVPTVQPLAATVIAMTLLAAGSLLLLWRRRRPEIVTALMAVLTVVCIAWTGSSQGFEIGMAFAIYAVASTRPARIAWWSLGGANLLVFAATWLWESPIDPAALDAAEGPLPPAVDMRFLSMLGVTVVSLAAIAIGISVRNRRLHIAQLIDRANEIARDRDQQAQLARASERARIAREMHDVVAHSLSVMIALADGAGAAMTRAPDRSRAALDELSSTGRSALADMRRVLGVLAQDAPLEPQPGYLDLGELVERFRTAGVPVRTEGLAQELPNDAGLQLAVYRIVQEALTNTLRHAPGTAQVTVALRRTRRSIDVEVLDAGATVPVPDAGGAGQGLIGMRERAGVYGGTVEAGPWRGGWRVHAVLPWHEETT
ncbi:MAG: histidine kinase [Actinotalea sp.]|nr:histidine kinase [Actinotalea sp.]